MEERLIVMRIFESAGKESVASCKLVWSSFILAPCLKSIECSVSGNGHQVDEEVVVRDSVTVGDNMLLFNGRSSLQSS